MTAAQTRRVGFVQYEVHPHEWEFNAATARRLVAATPADLLVLPEFALTGYDFPDTASLLPLAEPFGAGRTASFATELAAEFNVTIVIGYPERAEQGCYNSALLVTPDGAPHNYRKTHLFNREQDLFLHGDAPPPVIDTPAGRVGLMICFDWVFPEVARCLALGGAQIIAHPANLVLPWCQRAMFARSIENGVFIVTANRIGIENQAGRTLRFTGASQIMSPRGELLASAPADAECASAVTLVPADADDKSLGGRNDRFADRRPALYTALQGGGIAGDAITASEL